MSSMSSQRPHDRTGDGELVGDDRQEVQWHVESCRAADRHQRPAAGERRQAVRPGVCANAVDDCGHLSWQRLVGSEGAVGTKCLRQARPSCVRLVTQTSKPAARPSWMRAVAMPPVAPWISTVSPARRPDLVKSAR